MAENINNTFYFLCMQSKRHAYDHIIKSSPYNFVFFSDPKELVRLSLGAPPTAILIDIPTSIKLGTINLRLLENLYVIWPIIRCTINQSGFAIATSIHPPRRENLISALKSITAGDTSWNNKQYHRRHLRLNIPCRMKIRKLGNKVWCRGNCLNISSGGFFAVTYDPPGVNIIIEMQLLDLTTNPLNLKAHAVWSRQWENTNQLPGSGISIPEEWRTKEFRNALSQKKYVGNFFADYD